MEKAEQLTMETSEWSNDFIPVILPEVVLDYEDLEEWQRKALLDNKIVLIKDIWCILSKRIEVAPTPQPHLEPGYWNQFRK